MKFDFVRGRWLFAVPIEVRKGVVLLPDAPSYGFSEYCLVEAEDGGRYAIGETAQNAIACFDAGVRYDACLETLRRLMR